MMMMLMMTVMMMTMMMTMMPTWWLGGLRQCAARVRGGEELSVVNWAQFVVVVVVVVGRSSSSSVFHRPDPVLREREKEDSWRVRSW